MNDPKRYRLRESVEAIHAETDNDVADIKEWLGARNHIGDGNPDFGIPVRDNGIIVIRSGEWIDLLFTARYEEVNDG